MPVHLKMLHLDSRCFLIIYVIFLWRVNHCTNSPQFFSLLIFWCCFTILGEGLVVISSTIHLPHCFILFFSFLTFSICICVQKNKDLISVVQMLWWSYWVLLIRSNSNHKPKPSWCRRGTQKWDDQSEKASVVWLNVYFCSADIVRVCFGS